MLIIFILLIIPSCCVLLAKNRKNKNDKMQSENDKYYEKVEAGYYGDELPEESFD